MASAESVDQGGDSQRGIQQRHGGKAEIVLDDRQHHDRCERGLAKDIPVRWRQINVDTKNGVVLLMAMAPTERPSHAPATSPKRVKGVMTVELSRSSKPVDDLSALQAEG
jgi:osmotically-inducible protein OsmY